MSGISVDGLYKLTKRLVVSISLPLGLNKEGDAYVTLVFTPLPEEKSQLYANLIAVNEIDGCRKRKLDEEEKSLFLRVLKQSALNSWMTKEFKRVSLEIW